MRAIGNMKGSVEGHSSFLLQRYITTGFMLGSCLSYERGGAGEVGYPGQIIWKDTAKWPPYLYGGRSGSQLSEAI